MLLWYNYDVARSATIAGVAELADAHVWGACGFHRTGSSPVSRTNKVIIVRAMITFFFLSFHPAGQIYREHFLNQKTQPKGTLKYTRPLRFII